jgi:hypothetical protein
MGEEIGDVLKSFRETIRGGLQKGKERQESKGSTMYAKGGNVKRMRYGGEPDNSMDMGQPMRGMAPTPAPRGRGIAGVYGNPSPGAMQQLEKMKAQPRQKSGIPFEEGKGYGNRGPQPTLPPRPIEPPMMEDKVPPMPKRPDGEMVKTSTATSAPRPEIDPRGIKAGGQVKKMAQGGYAKADGVASRGKTQPKMVKMAKGGFVKNADGCAQRGRTKAFQVKMKRGGMC